MQRYRRYGTSYPPPASSAPVEEVHAEEECTEEEVDEEECAEEEVYEEEEVEPLIQEEVEPVVQETGGVNEEEEEQHTKEEVQPVVQETEGKTTPVESKNGKRTERGGGGGGGGGGEAAAGGGGGSKYSMFTWFVVLALLGVWSSVAVVYFDIVDYDSVIARAKEFRMNFSQVLQGKLTAYDTDGDGDFDVEDAKVLLEDDTLEDTDQDIKLPKGEAGQTAARENTTRGLKVAERPHVGDSPEEKTEETSERLAETTNQQAAEPQGAEPRDATSSETPTQETVSESGPTPVQDDEDEVSRSHDVESEIQAAVPLPPLVEDDFVPDDPRSSGHPYALVEEPPPHESVAESGQYLTSSKFTQEAEPVVEAENQSGPPVEPEPQSETPKETEAEGTAEKQAEEKLREKAKKKKPKLLNKLDKTIKAEIDAAEKLRKKGKLEEALRAFETLVQQHPQSPRARYGKAQTEDDLAEKLRSNDMLHKAVNSYREAAELPDVTSDLLRASLKRRAERQQFLGRMRGSLATLEKMVQIFPEDIGLKNELGVAHLLLGDNKGARKVFEEILVVAPGNGFAKVHYGFILKSENKIAESIPYLKEGLESGEPGTDDGRFYFHLGDALQRVGDNSAYDWYELGHKRGHFASVWQRSLYNVDGLKAQPWWTPKETGYTDLVRALERNWKTIREEALAVMDQSTGSFIPEEENLREKGEWGQYTIWQQGKKVGNACQGVPKTCSLLERYAEATGCKRGQIKFSVMHPGTHVWPHTGPTNCRLRMHLGLVVPKQGCRIRCTDDTRKWEEGKVLIFDDSFEHEVWQDADSYRLIFIVDVWHPELTAYQRQTLSPI
ncbi:aspartyl/asparaginyl beta-hydroxylase isoform X9 [Sebastes umbrosus]|uniref:aspartyl/asparaginyl beta-hydroxylase isoform X9 n=1 Tax=Sebastes umbrosus TaxID=72105 RepID=UPI00189F1A2D|nr:aspartyl/asparaginyl beta-hydroxylase isoform X9 [Sebastes umbrosus]